jgi:NACHT domain
MRARFGRIVGRLCVPWGGSLWMTPDGFLSEPPDSLGLLNDQQTSSPGALEPVSFAAATGTVVMLGEPGLGKSTSLQGLVRDLPAWEGAQAHENGLAWVDLVDVDATTFDELVTEPLQRLPSVDPGEDRRSAPSDGLEQATQPRLTLVLDGVDECPLEPKRLVGRLRRVLSRRDLGRLQLLVGCRTADYSRALHELLTALLPELRVVELAPLTRVNVAALAEDRGVDPNAFLAAVGAASAGALAAVPLTLDLLLRLFQRDGRLVGGAVALFEQGVLALADEPDEDRRTSELRTGSAHQRVAVAARVCATLVLCRKAAVWTGTASDLPETDVSYLAARHLVDYDVAEQQLRSLLVVVNELGHAAIHPALRETAAWLVALAPERTTWLAEVDLYNLAVHAAVVESPAVRRLLVRRLLEQAETVMLRDRPWARPRWDLFHSGSRTSFVPCWWRPSLRTRLCAHLETRCKWLFSLPVREAWPAWSMSCATSLVTRTGMGGCAAGQSALRQSLTGTVRRLGYAISFPGLTEPPIPTTSFAGSCWRRAGPDHLSVDELLATLVPPETRTYSEHTGPSVCA